MTSLILFHLSGWRQIKQRQEVHITTKGDECEHRNRDDTPNNASMNSQVADLLEPLVSIHSNLCPQRFSQNQDVAWYSPIRPRVKEKTKTHKTIWKYNQML